MKVTLLLTLVVRLGNNGSVCCSSINDILDVYVCALRMHDIRYVFKYYFVCVCVVHDNDNDNDNNIDVNQSKNVSITSRLIMKYFT